ncbi:hypothetical protein B9Z55_013851 [Caenorhabditis nigoni]|nr:hypothetical protein B9Z55_013851 [Caenorhabditis nigoni]
MKIKNIVSILLAFLVVGNVIYCFSINSKDKIVVEPGTNVVSDKQVYLPLGWPSKLTCDSSVKLKDLNIDKSVVLVWTMRFANGTDTILVQNGQ